jgi:hypothetical protein
MAHSLASRSAAAALLSLVLVSTGASTASARPDPIDLRPADTAGAVLGCALQRIDTQLVRCDNLTGAGVSAPLFIPELQPVPAAGAR